MERRAPGLMIGSGPPPAVERTTTLQKMCSGSKAGSYMRLIDSCITQLKAQESSRTCNESEIEEGEEEEELGTHKPVKAKSWQWLEPCSVRKSLNPFKLFLPVKFFPPF